MSNWPQDWVKKREFVVLTFLDHFRTSYMLPIFGYTALSHGSWPGFLLPFDPIQFHKSSFMYYVYLNAVAHPNQNTRPRRGWKKAAGFPPKSGVWCERCEFVCAARHTTPAWWWGFGTVVICPQNGGDMSTRKNWKLWKETSQKAGVLKWSLFGINSEF